MKVKPKMEVSGSKIRESRQHKNFSQTDLSTMLEVIVKSSKNIKTGTSTPNKKIDTVKSQRKEAYDSFEDLSKGLVVIVSGENSIPQTQATGYDTTKEIKSKFDHSNPNTKE